MTNRRYDIETLLEEVVTLPSLPQSIARLLTLLEDPACSLREVSRAISADPSISLKTLRLVNSAYYGLGQSVNTLEHAVMLLGVRVIKNLALTAAVFNSIGRAEDRFLRHSVACAVAMRVCAEAGPLASHLGAPDEAFVFGLLHDIGKVILEEFLPDESARIRTVAREDAKPWYRAEREILGIDHAQVGARLAEKWKLSSPIINAVAGHHDLSRCTPDTRMLAATLSVADYLCIASGFAGYEDAQSDLGADVWAASELSKADLIRIANRFFDVQSSIAELTKLAG